MKRFVYKLILLIGWNLTVLFLFMQLAYFLTFQYDVTAYMDHMRFVFHPSILFFQGNHQYFQLVMTVMGLGDLLLLLRLFMPEKGKQSKSKRRLTTDEKLQYAHLASTHEAKKRLQRIHFDKSGNVVYKQFSKKEIILGQVLIVLLIVAVVVWDVTELRKLIYHTDDSLMLWTMLIYIDVGILLFMSWGYTRDFADQVFDGVKKVYNQLLFHLHVQDIHKLNTIRKWKIGDENTPIRSGLPVVTRRKTMWVDPSDSHNLIIGTTNSGKTFSIIHEMIECSRMTGESMVINDLKGELSLAHRERLIQDGYKVIAINFINPAKGDLWNPFSLVIKTYRSAQKKAIESTDPQEYKTYNEKKIRYITLCGHLQSLISNLDTASKTDYAEVLKETQEVMKQQQELKAELIRLHDQLPAPDFSIPFEYLRDVASAIFPVDSEDGKNAAFWNQNGMRLLEGIVCFLLEYEYVEDGELKQLDDDQINFKSFQMTVNDGFRMIKTSTGEDVKPLLSYYLDELRFPTDQSVLKLKMIVDAPEETRGSITNVFATYTDLGILNDNISKMTSVSSFSFDELWNQKVAIFLIAHDEVSTYYPLSVIFLNQMIAEISREARKNQNQRLKYPVNILWDEFGISPPIKNLNNALSAARSKGVRFTLVIQDFSQLSIQYNVDFSEMIKNNTMNVVYLLGGNPKTQEEMAKRIGSKLNWNKEKGCYEVVPVITKERLSRLSVGEAVVVSQRKNPYLTRYLPYNRYVYYKNMPQPEDVEERELPKVHTFSFWQEYQQMINGNSAGCNTPQGNQSPVTNNVTTKSMFDFSSL